MSDSVSVQSQTYATVMTSSSPYGQGISRNQEVVETARLWCVLQMGSKRWLSLEKHSAMLSPPHASAPWIMEQHGTTWNNMEHVPNVSHVNGSGMVLNTQVYCIVDNLCWKSVSGESSLLEPEEFLTTWPDQEELWTPIIGV